ncbi:MAG: N-acetyltransferase [Gaiellaceae bacterium]|jgi:RimJ/RimL family protein N-acetyltransferase|nr:N-acetyltransferase [Gaiellaceae bacterium]
MWEGLSKRLEGQLVVLEPLREAHLEPLWEAAQDDRTWTWYHGDAPTREWFEAFLGDALEEAARGEEAPFATLDRRSGSVVGSTRFLSLRPEHRGLEIGSTWLDPVAWKTGVNVEAKLLMLEHAFERLGCMRVELKTDARNERSRAAMAALPAQFEGIHRKHMLRPYGVRDSAWYSVVDDEWPAVKANLERRRDAHLVA